MLPFLERKTRLEPTCVGNLALFLSPPTPSRGEWGRSLEPRFRKKSHLGGGIKKQHLLDAALFGAENETRAHGRGRSRAFFVTPGPLKGEWGRSCEPSFSTDVENKKQRMLGIVKSRRDRD